MGWCYGTNYHSSERLSLRGHAQRWTVPCFIRSRKALTFSTRLVFTVTIFTGFGVIFASIWFMLDCRHNFNSIQALIPKHSSFCTNLGMQALFACCVLLFTIFGLGCIGRRMTGHAILIISGVAIFQGAMTLIFYQCRAMANDDILKAVNTTLTSCSVGTRAPFASYPSDFLDHIDKDKDATKKYKTRFLKRDLNPALPRQSYSHVTQSHAEPKDTFNEGGSNVDVYEKQSPSQVNTSKNMKVNNSSQFRAELDQDLKRKLQDSTREDGDENENKVQMASQHSNMLSCRENSEYFVALAKDHGKSVEACHRVCMTYQMFCHKATYDLENVGKSEAAPSNSIDKNNSKSRNDLGEKGSRVDVKKKSDFDIRALACGNKILQYVREFCIYDNQIFTPLSLGTPIFYILMSFCFIYLAHCDRQLKDEDVFEPKHLRSASISSSKSSHHSLSSKAKKRRRSEFSALSPTSSHPQKTKAMPSPASSEVSSTWGDSGLRRESLYRESEFSSHQAIQPGSARTIETFLGDE